MRSEFFCDDEMTPVADLFEPQNVEQGMSNVEVLLEQTAVLDCASGLIAVERRQHLAAGETRGRRVKRTGVVITTAASANDLRC